MFSSINIIIYSKDYFTFQNYVVDVFSYILFFVDFVVETNESISEIHMFILCKESIRSNKLNEQNAASQQVLAP